MKLYEPILSTQALFKAIENDEAFGAQVVDNGLIKAAFWHRSPHSRPDGTAAVKSDLNLGEK